MPPSQSARQRYELLFPDDASKAAAFDKLAEHYYLQNFATLPKAEIDLLMFSEYLDRAYEVTGDGEDGYGDYELSKALGITQSRVRSYKERKELKYPSPFDWRAEFAKVLGHAEYRDERVRIFIPDPRLHTELCHLVERQGGYSEVTLTRQLLSVSPAAFVDLMVEAADNDTTREEMRERLASILRSNEIDPAGYLSGDESLSSELRGQVPGIAEAVIVEALGMLPTVGPFLSQASRGVVHVVVQALQKKLSGLKATN